MTQCAERVVHIASHLRNPGLRLSGKARNGNVWLRRNLCQAAWAASHTKNTLGYSNNGTLLALAGGSGETLPTNRENRRSRRRLRQERRATIVSSASEC